MCMTTINGKGFLSGYCAEGKEAVPDGLKFGVGAALTILGPVLFYAVVSGQFLALCLMIIIALLGMLLGLRMFFRRSACVFPCCVPDISIPKLRRAGMGQPALAWAG
jgi:hypothetical protein